MGATSMIAWLVDRTGRTPRQAQRDATVAARLTHLPGTRRVWVEGRLTGGQVDAIVAQLGGQRTIAFSNDEDRIIASLEGRSIEQTVEKMALWREQADANGRPPEDDDGSLHVSPVGDGYRIDGNLDNA